MDKPTWIKKWTPEMTPDEKQSVVEQHKKLFQQMHGDAQYRLQYLGQQKRQKKSRLLEVSV